MESIMGIITNTKSEELLKELTLHRSMSAVPFGGRYRLIDFVLSNMVNSGIRNVGIITSHKYRALLDHLGAGKEWGLDKKSEGLFYLPSASPSIFRKDIKFDLKDFYANYEYLEKSKQETVLISGNNMICNIDYRRAFSFHNEKGADITLFYKEETDSARLPENLNSFQVESDGRITNIWKIPNRTESNLVSMEMVVLKKELLLEILRVAQGSGNWDLTEILIEHLDDLRVFGYQHKGYLGKIDSVESYFMHNMDLLDREVWNELFFGKGLIFTKAKDGPPAKYTEEAQVTNILAASGCLVKGRVENSILFRGVVVEKGARINNSIIMQKCIVDENVHLENVILDKEVVIRRNTVLKGEVNKPIIIAKKTVI